MQAVIRPESPWQDFPVTYRAEEMATLIKWITVGASGAVLGLRGVGRSHLLGFLCHRPDVVQHYLNAVHLTVAFVPIDLGDLPSRKLADLYRVILRGFYEMRHGFPEDLQTVIELNYDEHRALTDPFLAQSALRQLLLDCQRHRLRVVLVIDRFDIFCHMLTPTMANALGGLYDAFSDTLLYIVGIRQSLIYLEELALDDDLYRLLTTHINYLGPLKEADARQLIVRRTQVSATAPDIDETQIMLALTGGYPTLLKAVCRWWLLQATPPPPPQWLSCLRAMPPIQHRLHSIWSGLTQEEQLTLTEVVKGKGAIQAALPLQHRQLEVLHTLAAKGICCQQAEKWSLFGTLFTDYVAQMGGMSRGRIWLDAATDTLHHGLQLLDSLTPKEHAVLHFLVTHAGMRHSYTDVIVNVWSAEENYNGVTNESLFQVIKGLRRKIEPNPARPVYVVNWRGKPEGGYIFYAEGKPM